MRKTHGVTIPFKCSFKLLIILPCQVYTQKIKDVKKNLNKNTAEFNPQIFLFPMEDWYLRNNFENGKQNGGRIKYVWLFGIIGLLFCFWPVSIL